MKPLDPTEKFAMRVLERLQDGFIMTRHDDGTQDGMYDFSLGGALAGAAAVTRVTGPNARGLVDGRESRQVTRSAYRVSVPDPDVPAYEPHPVPETASDVADA